MVRSVHPSPALDELGRRLVDQLDGVRRLADRIVDDPRPSAEAVHRLHRDLRRLRVGVSVWRRTGGADRDGRLRASDRRLKRIARLVGAVRDRDVARAVLRSAGSTLSPEERKEFRDLSRHLEQEARVGRALVRTALRAERDGGLFDGLRSAFAAAPPHRRDDDVLRYLEEVRAEGPAAIRAAHRRARRRPTSRRLHRLRLRVRRWRALTELADAIAPGFAPPDPGALRALQARLGRLHDLDVVEELTAEGVPAPVSRALRKERRRLRERLLRSLRADAATAGIPPEPATA